MNHSGGLAALTVSSSGNIVTHAVAAPALAGAVVGTTVVAARADGVEMGGRCVAF